MAFQITTEATLAAVVKAICARASYPIPNDPTSSQDPKIKQMIAAANAASAELFSIYEWPELIVEGSIDVFYDVPDQKEKGFSLPADFFRFIDQTQWNGAMRLPAKGPITPQGWMAYLVMPITSIFTLTWQTRGNQVWFLNPPAPPGMPFRFMYYSRATVLDGDDPSLLKNVASKNTDTFILDPALVTALSTAKWMEWNGFDSAAAARDYSVLYDARVGALKAAPILSAVRFGGLHLINAANVPATGYGTSP
jgi:hypothetical protein